MMKQSIFFIVFLAGIVHFSYAGIWYSDPNIGTINSEGTIDNPLPSLEEIINANLIISKEYNVPFDSSSILSDKNPDGLINSGDTIVLLNGLHGNILLRNYINDESIHVIGESHEAILEKVVLQGCRKWSFENLAVSQGPYGNLGNGRLVDIDSHGWHGPCKFIDILNCSVYSSTQVFESADDWLQFAGGGIYLEADSSKAIKNTLTNVDMGLSILADHCLVSENTVLNFAGDGMRILGSHNEVSSNFIANNFNVDDNHDDGIQSFTTNGYIVDSNWVHSNMIINRLVEDQAFPGPLQGIACFDGFYNGWLVENNVVSVDHWHGITFLGARNCTIRHNTIIDPTPNIEPGPTWIRVDEHKDGTPSEFCGVYNNVANKLVVDADSLSNRTISTLNQYSQNFVDVATFDFHLSASSSLINSGDSGYSSNYDKDGNIRNDLQPDIGAFEFQMASSLEEANEETNSFSAFPNPFSNKLTVEFHESDFQCLLADNRGQIITNKSFRAGKNQWKVDNLFPGTYFLIVHAEDQLPKVIGLTKID